MPVGHAVVPFSLSRPRRVATLSVHTSPLDQPGTGDAGGMNVYVVETSRRLADGGHRGRDLHPGHVQRRCRRWSSWPRRAWCGTSIAGPFEGLAKEDLPAQLCAFTAGVLRVEAAREPGWYDLMHSHYWLSGQVGWLARTAGACRWCTPRTPWPRSRTRRWPTATRPEPLARVIGEEQVVAEADRLVANTADEADQLRRAVRRRPDQVVVVPPGVDLDLFRPAADAGRPRDRLGRAAGRRCVLLFVGRIQPLKAPDLLLRAAAQLLERDPELPSRLQVVDRRRHRAGPGSTVPRRSPTWPPRSASPTSSGSSRRRAPTALADWYRAADVTVVPSYSESFGLVALESQACGTPVVAAAVGGLPTAVGDGESGVLVDWHTTRTTSRAAIGRLITAPGLRARMAGAARRHAERFSWQRTAEGLLVAYRGALADRGERPARTRPSADR